MVWKKQTASWEAQGVHRQLTASVGLCRFKASLFSKNISAVILAVVRGLASLYLFSAQSGPEGYPLYGESTE